VRFSKRTRWQLGENPLSTRRRALERQGSRLFDLAETNPTRCGLDYPAAGLAEAFARAPLLPYDPEPFGLPDARAALAEDLAGQATLPPDALILTPSTSEAYAWLFKLLCDPGDDVLVPQPSYPLFEYLAGLEDVALRPYRLELDEGFAIVLDSLASGKRTRAVLVVHPNNPTGTLLRRHEWRALAERCAQEGWALIADEVFLDFAASKDPDALGSLSAEESPCLTFVLNGLSKRGALPQLKLGWISVHGPQALVAEARARLEVIADTYLPVGTPVQAALPALLPIAKDLREQVRARVAHNRSVLAKALRATAPFHLLPSDGGWQALIRLPGSADEEALCLLLLDAGVVVQPGYFFDFPRGRFLVLSLLPKPEHFDPGVERMVEVLSSGDQEPTGGDAG
jgi:aspartate/methionine/tyrosine aminotransferase